MIAAVLVFVYAQAGPRPPSALYDYLRRPDRSFAYRVTARPDLLTTQIELTSQTWQGLVWKHTLLLRRPARPAFRGRAILYVTGDGPRSGDLAQLALVTEATGMPTAMLFDVPNQPLLGGRKEDDLIATTFERYLAGGDASWPLLFPMVKSALRAMDAVERVTADEANPIRRFVVTGGSKRGWTTWLVGAARDRRVVGIAPMVYDNLNLRAQMRHQLADWGAYSEQIDDYSRRGLQARMDERNLATMVDPYSYRSEIRVPTLIVNGSNDPYWTVDALSLYWSDLRQRKWLLTVPNAGHTLGNGLMAVETIGAFARSLAGDFVMPNIRASFRTSGSRYVVDFKGTVPDPVKFIVWGADSSTLDFRASTYKQLAFGGMIQGIEIPLAPQLNHAVFVEFRYKLGGREFSLSLPTQVVKATAFAGGDRSRR